MENNTANTPGLFEKGGKLGFLHSTVDAFDTFLRVPGTVTSKGVHVRDAIDMKRAMIIVVLALVPAALFGMWNLGHQHNLLLGSDWGFFKQFWFGFLKALPLYIVSYAVGLFIEFAFAQIKNEEVNEGYLVTGMLIPLIVPVEVPLWTLAIAVAFAVVFGKEVFGGTGMNFLNPALLTRAFLFFSYPSHMSGSFVWVGLKKGEVIDAASGATPLSLLSECKEAVAPLTDKFSYMDMFLGTVPGSIGETSVIAILLGAIILVWTGIASWKTMFSVFVGGALTALMFNAFGIEGNAMANMPWYEHLALGGFCFGAVFMATDPVTSARTEKGKWIYGLLIGFLAICIRVLNPGYPEGMMLAILMMNIFAPLIDYYVVDANIKRRNNRVKPIAK